MKALGRKRRWAKPLLTGAVATLVLLPVSARAQIVTDTAVVPDIRVATLDGDSVDVHSLLAPKLTLMVIWATWCAPCIVEMPVLKEFDEKWRPRGVHIVSIFRDDTAVAKARWIVEQQQLPYPVLMEPGDPEFRAALPGRAMPNGYIVKADGKVVIWYAPPPDLGFIEDRVEHFLTRYKLK